MRTFRRWGAALLLACLFAGSVFTMSAEAALTKVTGLTFVSWADEDCTSCVLKWKGVSGANVYQLRLSYSDGSKEKYAYSQEGAKTAILTGLKGNRVYKVSVRAMKANSKGTVTARGAWSDPIYTMPMPTVLSITSSGNGLKFTWTRMYGCNGYVIELAKAKIKKDGTIVPIEGTWCRVRTVGKEKTTSAVVKNYNKSALKAGNYCYRVRTRLTVNEKNKVSPLPSKNYFENGFNLSK